MQTTPTCMLQKNIFGDVKQLENYLNRIIYSFIAKGNPVNLPANSETFVNQGYAGNVNIYPIIRKIVQPAIGVKWKVKDYETDEEVEDTDLNLLLKNPNPRQSFNEFIDELITWRLVTGNNYIYWIAPLNGINKGKPAELWALPSDKTEIIAGDMWTPVQEYRLLVGNTTIKIPPNNVIHGRTTNLKYESSGQQLYGMSPLECALKVMTATNYAYEGLSKQFENGGPDVIVTGTDKESDEYTEEQKQSVWSSFTKRFSGSKNKGKWLIKKRPVEVHEIGKSPVDLNILEFMKLTKADYCNIYNVPLVLMNDNSAATYNNMAEAVKMLWNNAVIPELEYLKDSLNKVAEQYNKAANTTLAFDFILDDIPELQTDKGVQAQSLSTAWWLTPNQRLVAMGFDPDPNPLMDMRFVPMGLIPLDELMTAPTPDEVAKFYNGKNRY